MAEEPGCTTSAPDPASMRTWRDLMFAHSAILAKMGDDLQEATGLTLAQYDVLLRLHEAPENTLRMGEIAEGVLVTTSGLTRVVDRLEQGGLVERLRVENDRRGVRVKLTESGAATLRIASDVHADGIRRYFAELIRPDEAEALGRFFARLDAAHNKAQPVTLEMPAFATTPR